jgi:hypothetical protein
MSDAREDAALAGTVPEVKPRQETRLSLIASKIG